MPANRDLDAVADRPVNEAVILRDPARPPSSPLMTQGLGLADPLVPVPQRYGDCRYVSRLTAEVACAGS
jgi:hypothetical protein